MTASLKLCCAASVFDGALSAARKTFGGTYSSYAPQKFSCAEVGRKNRLSDDEVCGEREQQSLFASRVPVAFDSTYSLY
jgi:hypothetical protein